MIKKKTDELNALLENMRPSQFDEYIKENGKYLAGSEKAFYYYVKEVLDDKHIKLKDLYIRAGVSESYGSQIIRMEKHTADRNLILRFCIAGRFNWEETNRALKLYGMSELYSKNPRDACLIVAINNKIFDCDEIDEILEKKGFEQLFQRQILNNGLKMSL